MDNLPTKFTFIEKVRFLFRSQASLNNYLTELGKREEAVKAREEAVKAREEAVGNYLGKEDVEVGSIELGDRLKVEGTRKMFKEIILRLLNDFKANIDSLKIAEKSTNIDMSKDKEFEMLRFQAKILGLLTLYIERDNVTKNFKAMAGYRKATDDKIREFFQKNCESDQIDILRREFIGIIFRNSGLELAVERTMIEKQDELESYSPSYLRRETRKRAKEKGIELHELSERESEDSYQYYSPAILEEYKNTGESAIERLKSLSEEADR